MDPAILMEEIKKRTLNVTIIYPPTLASEFQVSEKHENSFVVS